VRLLIVNQNYSVPCLAQLSGLFSKIICDQLPEHTALSSLSSCSLFPTYPIPFACLGSAEHPSGIWDLDLKLTTTLTMTMSLEAARQTLCHVGTMRSVCGLLDCAQPVFLNPCLGLLNSGRHHLVCIHIFAHSYTS
jgi:hypothetical protein